VDLLYLHDYYMPIVGKFYYWLTRKKWIYDAHELIFNKKKSKISLRTKFFVCLEKISINSAALVISANYERSRLMKTYFSLKDLPVPVLNISDISNSENSHLLVEEKFPFLKNN